MLVDDNGVSIFVDDLGVSQWVDDNGLLLGARVFVINLIEAMSTRRPIPRTLRLVTKR